MFLESKSKFDIRSPDKNRPFSPDNFFVWSNTHMYRTSSNDMGFLKVFIHILFHRVLKQTRILQSPNIKDIFQARWLIMNLARPIQQQQERYFLLRSLTPQVSILQQGNLSCFNCV